MVNSNRNNKVVFTIELTVDVYNKCHKAKRGCVRKRLRGCCKERGSITFGQSYHGSEWLCRSIYSLSRVAFHSSRG